MPIHFEDLDLIPEIAGLRSVLIVPCNMCPAVTVAVRADKPFMQLYKSFLKSPPFEEYLTTLQSKLREQGVTSKVFRSRFYHHWFMCMWSKARQKKLRKEAKKYDAVIVLGCESATVTVHDAIHSLGCKVIEGMRVSGIMNAKLTFSTLGNISFADHKTIPITGETNRKYRHSINGKNETVPVACPPGAVKECLS